MITMHKKLKQSKKILKLARNVQKIKKLYYKINLHYNWKSVANNQENKINKWDKKCLKIVTKMSNSNCFA